MAADVDMNAGNLDLNGPEPESKPSAKKPNVGSAAPRTSAAAEANTTTNAFANSD
jgi:hypothetical protein